MFWTIFFKTQNIVQTMHLTMLIGHVKQEDQVLTALHMRRRRKIVFLVPKELVKNMGFKVLIPIPIVQKAWIELRLEEEEKEEEEGEEEVAVLSWGGKGRPVASDSHPRTQVWSSESD